MHFKENCLQTVKEFTIALVLYVDDFEVANHFGIIKVETKCAKSVGHLEVMLSNNWYILDSFSSDVHEGVKDPCVRTVVWKEHVLWLKMCYSPDILHEVLKGTVSVVPSLCLSDLMAKWHFKPDKLNQASGPLITHLLMLAGLKQSENDSPPKGLLVEFGLRLVL